MRWNTLHILMMRWHVNKMVCSGCLFCSSLWRQENTLQQSLSMSRDELYKQEQGLRSVTGKAVLNGTDSIHKVLDRLKARGDHKTAEGYYGTLIENFTCDKKFYTCVEVTAGSRLV